MNSSTFWGTFFSDQEEAYLTAYEGIVKLSRIGTNTFSISIAEEPHLPPQQFRPLPASFWDKLRPRLEAKGIDVSGYVPCEKLKRKDGAVGLKANGRPASIYEITHVR